jgi:hypothetical protein
MGGVEVHKMFWWGSLREREHLENLGIDGRITLKRSLNKSGYESVD